MFYLCVSLCPHSRHLIFAITFAILLLSLSFSSSLGLPLSVPWHGNKTKNLDSRLSQHSVISSSVPNSLRSLNETNGTSIATAIKKGEKRNSMNKLGARKPNNTHMKLPPATSLDKKIDATKRTKNPGTPLNANIAHRNISAKGMNHTVKITQAVGAFHRRKLASAENEEGEGEGEGEESDDSSEESQQQSGDVDNNVSDDNTENSESDTSENESGHDASASSSTSETVEVNSPEFAKTIRAAAPHSDLNGRHTHTNMTHLSNMLLKIIKTYNVKSVADIPCRNSLAFFPKLLPKLDFEVMGFKYYCIDSEKDTHEDIAHFFGDAGNPEIMHLKPTETSMLPKTDLVFSWDGPQDWGVTKTWTFFANLRNVRPKYLLITNNPTELNADRPGVLNLRKQPFHFAQANRVLSKVHASENPSLGLPKKQLLFYEINDIRRGF